MARKRITISTTWNEETSALIYKMAFCDNTSFPRFLENLANKEAEKRGIKI
jgi:hypothetical protein